MQFRGLLLKFKRSYKWTIFYKVYVLFFFILALFKKHSQSWVKLVWNFMWNAKSYQGIEWHCSNAATLSWLVTGCSESSALKLRIGLPEKGATNSVISYRKFVILHLETFLWVLDFESIWESILFKTTVVFFTVFKFWIKSKQTNRVVNMNRVW